MLITLNAIVSKRINNKFQKELHSVDQTIFTVDIPLSSFSWSKWSNIQLTQLRRYLFTTSFGMREPTSGIKNIKITKVDLHDPVKNWILRRLSHRRRH